MTQAGWTALLIGSLEFDCNDRRSTERVQRLAADIGNDLDHGVISAWAQELKAWVALNDGDYRAVTEAQIGQAMAPHSPIVVQLLGHEAEALGRIGDLPAAERALGRMNELRTKMTRPDPASLSARSFQIRQSRDQTPHPVRPGRPSGPPGRTGAEGPSASRRATHSSGLSDTSVRRRRRARNRCRGIRAFKHAVGRRSQRAGCRSGTGNLRHSSIHRRLDRLVPPG